MGKNSWRLWSEQINVRRAGGLPLSPWLLFSPKKRIHLAFSCLWSTKSSGWYLLQEGNLLESPGRTLKKKSVFSRMRSQLWHSGSSLSYAGRGFSACSLPGACGILVQQIWKTQQWPQDWKRSVFIPIPKKGNATECSNYHTIALISHASKVSAQNSPSQASAIREPWTSRCSRWF